MHEASLVGMHATTESPVRFVMTMCVLLATVY